MLLIGLFHNSGIFAARTPASRTLQFRECYGLPTANWYHGNLTPPRNAPSRPFREKTGVSLYPESASWQATAPHGCSGSLLIARSGMEVMAAEAKLLRRNGKIRSTDYSVVKELRRWLNCPLHYTTDIFSQKLGTP